MKYCAPLFAVQSIETAKRFYQEVLGLKITMDFGTNVTFEDSFSLQEGYAELAGFPKEKTVWNAHNAELYFETEDLNADEARLKAAAVTFMHGIQEYPWGQRVLRCYDPDGNIIEIGETMQMVVRRFLAQGMSVEETATRTQHPLEFVRMCQQTESK